MKKELGKRIKEIRTDHKLTQQEFANQLSISRPFVSRMENDKEIPSDTLLKLISATYNVELTWLEFELGDKYKSKERQLKGILTRMFFDNSDNLDLGLETPDCITCVSILLKIFKNPMIKDNSHGYFRRKIQSILNILEYFFKNGEYETEAFNATITYIERVILEAVDSFETENLDDSDDE